MRLPRIFRTTAFRLSLGYALLFLASTAVMFRFIHGAVVERSEDQLEDLVQAEAAALLAEGERAPIARVIERWEREPRAHPASYLLFDASGRRVAGTLATTAPIVPRKGWQRLVQLEDDGEHEPMLARGTVLGDGSILLVAAETEEHDELVAALWSAFGWAGGASLALALAGGLLTSRAFLRRLEGVDRAAGRIIDGALDQRMPLRGTGDEIDRISQRLNAMLDRIQALVESLRQVSNDVAHDLRTPLARLRHGLEVAEKEATDVASYRAAIARATAECDRILATFGALLRIAQIESSTRRRGFRAVDLSKVFETIAELYGPAAEDHGHALETSIEPGITVRGDGELLTQMIANVVDNAIQHTPRGTRIQLELRRQAGGAVIGEVADDGPGVPEADRARVFDRFVRLDASRSTPGSGLGLSLVAAVAELHGIDVALLDRGPGARLRLAFERAADMGLEHA